MITGNLQYRDIERHYNSKRIRSRLAEVVGPDRWAMDGIDWREVKGAM